MPDSTPKDFRQFEKYYNQVVEKQRKRARKSETPAKFLTPANLRDHIAKNESIKLKYGNKANDNVITYSEYLSGAHGWDFGWIEFEVKDLKAFEKAFSKTQKAASKKQGLPIAEILKLVSKSVKFGTTRIRRANKQIKSALLYKIQGDMLSYQVAAAPSKNKKTGHYRVKIRLEGYDDAIQDPKVKNYNIAAQKAVNGPVSVDCSCEDYQYRFRYLAHRLNCGIRPVERDFPKVRNPYLAGFCCKHLIKAMFATQQQVAVSRIATEMERVAKKGGTEDKTTFIGKKDLAELKKGFEQQKRTIKDVKKEYKKFKEARKAFDKKKKEEKSKRSRETAKERRRRLQLEKQVEDLQAKQAAMQAKADHDRIKAELQGMLKMGKRYGAKSEDIIKDFAEEKGIPVETVEGMVK